MFDLTSHQIDCVNKITIAPVVLPLAPAVAELDLRGDLFQSNWTISLREQNGLQSLASSESEDSVRDFPLCRDTSLQEKALVVGALPSLGADSESSPTKRQDKRQ